MRVAMGLALQEKNREARAIEFYDVLSSFDFMSSTPTLFNSGTLRSQLSSCYLTTVSDDLDRHLRRDQGKRAARQVRRRPGQRLDAGARARLAHQGHQRQVAGRGAVPEGGERHRGGGQPGRQAQGRGVLLPRDLAPRHRGVPRAAQEHRRRPAPHARHEHRQLDPGSVHEAGDGGRRVDPVQPLGRARPARQVRQELRGSLPALRGQGGARRAQAAQEDSGAAAVAQDALDAVRDRASLDHLQGSVQPAQPAAARRGGAQLQPVHRDHPQHLGRRDRGVQPGLDQPGRAPRPKTGWISQR